MRDDGEPYEIGRLKGECVLSFWVTVDGQRKRKRHRLGTGDEAEARRRAPAVYAHAVRPQGKTVKELWDAYLLDKKGRPVATVMPFEWKALAARFGTMDAEAIEIADCRAHIAERRAAGRKDGTIITELGRLRMVVKWALKHKLISQAPDIERPAAVKRKERHLTAHEVRRLAGACKAPHLELFVHVAYATAGRAGAILGLTWERCDFEREKIDLEDPEIVIPHKGRAIVPMTRTLKTRLLAAQAGARSPFVIEWNKQRVRSVKKGLSSAAEAAGLQHTHPHLLRHSAAVRMAETGIDMEEIRSYLGHENVATTRRIYARFSPNHLRGAAASLELDEGLETVAPRRTHVN
ncbi:tyrosine-type recombinase/integrase [Methylobacterium sp. A49B]